MAESEIDTTGLDPKYRDTLNPKRNCPGFQLWEVLGSDGVRYLMAGDHKGGVETRLFFATNNAIQPVSITLLGPNPDVEAWHEARGEKWSR
jgi:hypothetical protein